MWHHYIHFLTKYMSLTKYWCASNKLSDYFISNMAIYNHQHPLLVSYKRIFMVEVSQKGLLLLCDAIPKIVKSRSRKRSDLLLLLNSSWLCIIFIIACFKLDKIQEVRLLSVKFCVRSYIGGYIYFRISVSVHFWMDFSMSCWMDIYVDPISFCIPLNVSMIHEYCGTYIVTIAVRVSTYNTLLWMCVIPTTSFTSFSYSWLIWLSSFFFLLSYFPLFWSIFGITTMMRSLNPLKIYP